LVTETVAASVKTVEEKLTADFTEKLKAKEDEIAALRNDVNKQTTSSKRGEIISFVENIPAEKGKHFLKRAGIVEFMEALARDDEADEKSTEAIVCFSEGEDGKKEEHKFSRLDWAKNLFTSLPSMIEFGEKFGSITATKEADVMVDSNRVNAMKDEMGIKDKGGQA
jgi:hypothetical protein